jgi:hypothetical protein
MPPNVQASFDGRVQTALDGFLESNVLLIVEERVGQRDTPRSCRAVSQKRQPGLPRPELGTGYKGTFDRQQRAFSLFLREHYTLSGEGKQEADVGVGDGGCTYVISLGDQTIDRTGGNYVIASLNDCYIIIAAGIGKKQVAGVAVFEDEQQLLPGVHTR